VTRKQIVISALVVVAGLVGAQSITRVDQELRVIYTEYTLAATNLGHIHGELIRYRTSIIRAIEADSREDFERIATSLPNKRARIDAAIDRFVQISQSTLSGRGINAKELTELRDVRASIAKYIDSSYETIRLLEQRWQTSSPIEAKRLRDKAELHAATDAGEKFIAITRELDQLVDVVVQIAGDLQKDADHHLRVVSAITVGVSIGLAGLVLVL
jgi:hypothetical protein